MFLLRGVVHCLSSRCRKITGGCGLIVAFTGPHSGLGTIEICKAQTTLSVCGLLNKVILAGWLSELIHKYCLLKEMIFVNSSQKIALHRLWKQFCVLSFSRYYEQWFRTVFQLWQTSQLIMCSKQSYSWEVGNKFFFGELVECLFLKLLQTWEILRSKICDEILLSPTGFYCPYLSFK